MSISSNRLAIVALAAVCLPVSVVAVEQPSDAQAAPKPVEGAQEKKKPRLDAKKRDEAIAALTSRRDEAASLRDKATEVTKEIGALASSGKLPQDADAVAQMKRMVDEIAQINTRLAKIEEEIQGILGWIEGQNEALPILTQDVGDLKKHKWGNYVQFQYQDTDRKGASNGSVPYDAFRMRRIRLGFTETVDPRTAIKVSFDLATGTNQTSAQLRDAMLIYDVEPSDVKVGTQIVMGQQALPLGYELERSSSEREFPERAQYNQVMFNGERSRGVVVRHGLSNNTSIEVGLMNALTFNDAEQANLAPGPGNRLAGMARLRYFGTNYDFGISTFQGERPAYISGTPAVTSPKVDRQFTYLDGTYVGLFDPKLFIRGEVMIGKDRVPNATASASRTAKDMSGYQVQLGYNLNARNQINVRYETFDPDTDTGGNFFKGYGLAYIYYINPGARLTLAHEIFEDDARAANAAVGNQRRYRNTTLRMQFRF